MSLKRKTFAGFVWVSLSTIMLKIINFIISIILARLLAPSDFGLVAIGMIVAGFFETFRDFGIGSSLIYKRDELDKAANTAFFIFPVIAAAFYAFSYLIAPMAADFFKEESLTIIIRVLSLTFLIFSLGNLPNILLRKDLKFKKMFFPQIIPKLGYGTVAIGMALYGFGVWSLVIGKLVIEILSVITYWHSIEWRPSYSFDKKVAIELIGYGKHVLLLNLILFFISVIDVTFIGRFLGSEQLGYYSIALGVATLFSSQISSMFSQVLFPTYSKMEGDKALIKKTYIKMLEFVSIIVFPTSVGLAAIAFDFVKVSYGDKWIPAVAALQVLCFYGLSKSLLGITSEIYLAIGKPEIRAKFMLVQFFLILIFMYPLTIYYGILGTSISLMFPSMLTMVIILKDVGKNILDEKLLFFAKVLFPSIIGSLIMVSTIYIWQFFSASLSVYLRLSFSIIIGSFVYIIFLWLSNKKLFYEIRGLIERK